MHHLWLATTTTSGTRILKCTAVQMALHLSLPTFHPASNGLAEHCVQSFKSAMKSETEVKRDIWEEKKLPEDRTEGVTVKIPKKGALKNCKKSRGITLLSVPRKILAKIIVQPIAETVDQHLRREHPGYWKAKGSTDQIFILRNIIEQCTECQRQLYINL
ncbi:uncharacterized protein [Pocillopora verrucosa]|uniref:uncharacterized protein n=1 Tax=Pocillopora verrucosa TaxID=203993 RepID=UPI0033415DAB